MDSKAFDYIRRIDALKAYDKDEHKFQENLQEIGETKWTNEKDQTMNEKLYRVQMNSKGMPNFATAEEAPEVQQRIKQLSQELWNINREKSGRKDGFVDGKYVKDALIESEDE